MRGIVGVFGGNSRLIGNEAKVVLRRPRTMGIDWILSASMKYCTKEIQLQLSKGILLEFQRGMFSGIFQETSS